MPNTPVQPGPFPVGEQGEVLSSDPRDSLDNTPDEAKDEQRKKKDELVRWVVDRVRQWKEHRNSNYEDQWNMYERLWRIIYSDADKAGSRGQSERSKLISPALSEAVENAAAEIEEAAFGRGDFFDISAENADTDIMKAVLNKNEMAFREDLAKMGFTATCSEVIINSAVYGTGIVEIILTSGVERDVVLTEEVTVPEQSAAPEGGEGQPAQTPPAQQVRHVPGTVERNYERPRLRSVNPRNFVIDPAARSVDEALGCAVEEDVSAHIIKAGIQSGDYNKVPLTVQSGDTQTKPDPQGETPWVHDVVNVIRYYGKVPKHLLQDDKDTKNEDGAAKSEEPVDAEMVEAWVIIANEQHLLKGTETPDMMGDRPIVAHQWDIVPGRFWGRGVCAKGATSQKLLDAELRYRADTLAYTMAPMMAMDASKLPRGFKLEVYPGKNVLLAGDPSTILKPFKFGELDQNSGQQVELLDKMVQRATGAVDTVALAQGGVSGQARSGAVSMALTGVVKRNKRTLMRYVDTFLAPTLRKLLWRFMQYDFPRYFPANMTFNVASTMGIMQREYETQNIVQALGVVQQGTTEHLVLLMGLVANSGMQNRDEVMSILRRRLEQLRQAEANPPQEEQQPPMDPVAIELARQGALLDLHQKQADIQKTFAEIRKMNAETQNEMLEPELKARELALRGIYATSEERINKEFDRRMKVAELMLESEGIKSRERIADKQIVAAQANEPPAPTLPVVKE